MSLMRQWLERRERPAREQSALTDFAEEALLAIDERGVVRAANRAAGQLCPRLLIGANLGDALPAEGLATLVSDMRQLDESEIIDQVSIAGRPYRARLQRLAGRHGRIVISLQDISELVRLNRARRDMVANISHELRTPISNIRIIIENLFHEKERPKRGESINSVRAIQREADALQHLAEELLALSMMETGQVLLRMQPVGLRRLVREICEREEERRERAAVVIHNRVSREMRALADRDQLRRALMNLLHNALKWTPAGGQIEIDAEAAGDEITITVRDSGPGVPADQTARIFERFYRVDDSRSRGEGLGLGLAICRHIVEAHGGRIWAEPGQPGGGHFAFTLLAA